MKLQITFLLIALFAVLSLAADSDRQVIVSYPKGTPQNIMDEAMEEIRKAGGMIEHEYSLIKGFVATGPAKIFETVKTMGEGHNVLVEEDKDVHAINS
ncbi:hypothetical protein KC367_g6534 [Hortaea werneckii]|uniref:Inhibitor I9 domain-containing protein n=2 Tax=Hortaea werneckii TaxID=91943 RepID=A0A3M7INI6_HORWE|nr:hypothetical protein KC361_g5705 [Hortaea werneckii]OTA30922.1 hypothetical protein BTJ68_10153 [Hortaea werneckii EXF-2000]KAI6827659.1 hypothetical protein KC358_g7437 [Hortaea werneckii]KAI6833863.1 hypothetical protein KC350_g6861 [Hortaea werneckii]KAI6883235.1 hypothetical protein KC325_g5193 [Hortaea werneckii]